MWQTYLHLRILFCARFSCGGAGRRAVNRVGQNNDGRRDISSIEAEALRLHFAADKNKRNQTEGVDARDRDV